jgi:FKBP-type peptidyl-prolyl cis-trans isomerase SlyD
MEIEHNKVVVFHYTLTDIENSFTESSEDGAPIAYLHGHGNIVPGLESELAGKRAGDEFEARVEPEGAYGPRDEAATQRVPIKHLIRPGKLAAGDVVTINTREGQRRATVTKVGHHHVDVDLNHPLAGRTLLFGIRVIEVRDATSEELAHGHVHGPGGHH